MSKIKMAELNQEIFELKRLLKEREDELKQLELDEREKDAGVWLANIDSLIAVTSHSRTSCSDENPDNESRCTRCTLIMFKQDQHWDPTIELTVMLDGVHFKGIK